MAKYLLIESRNSLDAKDADNFQRLASGLVDEGHEVTLFLIQNGVFPARKCPASEPLSTLSRAGATVLADNFSLKERGIGPERLAPGIQAQDLSVVVDQMADGAKTLWH